MFPHPVLLLLLWMSLVAVRQPVSSAAPDALSRCRRRAAAGSAAALVRGRGRRSRGPVVCCGLSGGSSSG